MSRAPIAADNLSLTSQNKNNGHRSKCLLLALSFLCFSLNACQDKSNAPLSNTYHGYHYSIHYPKAWCAKQQAEHTVILHGKLGSQAEQSKITIHVLGILLLGQPYDHLTETWQKLWQ